MELKMKNEAILKKFRTPLILGSKGQALVTLLVFSALALIITTAATTVLIINSQGTSRFSLGEEALSYAETGADNAILRLLRDPGYTGETMTLGDGTAIITVSGALNKRVVSEGIVNDFRRKIEVTGSFNNNILVVTSWREID